MNHHSVVNSLFYRCDLWPGGRGDGESGTTTLSPSRSPFLPLSLHSYKCTYECYPRGGYPNLTRNVMMTQSRQSPRLIHPSSLCMCMYVCAYVCMCILYVCMCVSHTYTYMYIYLILNDKPFVISTERKVLAMKFLPPPLFLTMTHPLSLFTLFELSFHSLWVTLFSSLFSLSLN